MRINRNTMTHRLTAGIIYAAFVVCLTGCGGNSYTPTPPPASFSSTVSSIVSQNYTAYGLPSISIAISHQGVPFYQYSVGDVNLAAKIAARPESIYQMGSLSKQFTTTAILQLANASPPLLSLTAPIANYFPGFDPRITIAEMATNTSGLEDYTHLPQFGEWAQNGVSQATLIQTVQAQPLAFVPGTFYQYSNTNFYVLAALVAQLTRTSFETYLTNSILVPAGLTSTYYYLAPSGNALGYDGLTSNNPEPRLPVSTLIGSGSMSSTVLDLCKWDWELLGGKILPPSVITQMITPPDVPILDNPSTKSVYAYGLANIQHYNRTEILHTGEVPGFKSITATFLDTGWSVSILVNNSSFDINELRLQIEDAVCSPTSAFVSQC